MSEDDSSTIDSESTVRVDDDADLARIRKLAASGEEPPGQYRPMHPRRVDRRVGAEREKAT